MTRFIQHSPPHPGKILLELYLEPLKLNVTQAAEKLLITRPNMSAILNGKAGISPVMAVKLGKAFKTSPLYWLNMQASFDLWEVLQKEEETLSKVEVLI